MTLPLTPRQASVLAFIRDYHAESGFMPSRRDIAKRFGFGSLNAAQMCIDLLVERGYIERVPGIARGLRLVRDQEPAAATSNQHGRTD